MSKQKIIKTDCGVVGGGLAGCSAAIELAEAGKKVDLFVKGALFEDCNSFLLAGGLAAVPDFSDKDSFELHIKETLSAGKGLNDQKVVRFCIEHFYQEVIQWLIDKGVQFDKITGTYSLHREGGHSQNRVFHVKDTTGKSIMEVLCNLILSNPNIRVHEHHMAIDLITKNKISKKKEKKDSCLGFYVYDIANDEVKTVACEATFLATGGLGRVFLYTSNSDVSTGDGFAMCYRVGIPLANMEFIQFHPTVFYDIGAASETERRFLLTEALRGAGAILKLSKDSKEDFVLKYDPMGSRATRDVVAQAEDTEMRKKGLKHVWLDCTKIGAEKLKTEFKNSYEFCLKKGIDLTKEPVSVVYAEHYSNGGVLVDINGETPLRNCYVIGEAACTGLHGATRLASNSGPECVLFGRLAAKHFLSSKAQRIDAVPLWTTGKAKDCRDKVTVNYYWETVRRAMTSLCGICRNKERLTAAKQILDSLEKNINDFYWSYKVSKEFLEVRNIADVASAIIESALQREESRACHYREDFPQVDAKLSKINLIRR